MSRAFSFFKNKKKRKLANAENERRERIGKIGILTVTHRDDQAEQYQPDGHFGERGGRHLRHRIYHRVSLKEDRSPVFRRSDRARRYARVLSSKRMVACDLYPHDDDACKTPSVSPFYERVNVRSSDVTNDFDFHPELLSRSLQFPLQSLAPLRSRLSRLRLGNIQRSSVGNLPSSPFPWSSLSLSLSFFLSFSFSL